MNTKELTTAELKKELEKREKADRAREEKETREYLQKRDDSIVNILFHATHQARELKKFKQLVHEKMEFHQEKLNALGKIRGNSKGGFSITSSDGQLRVTRLRQTTPQWDERSQKAVELIADFLRDTVKKKDLKLFEILLSFIQKNDKGELEYDKVMHLISHEEKYEDERWKEGLKLIKDSYSLDLRGFGYIFKTKNEEGKWETLDLNFSSL